MQIEPESARFTVEPQSGGVRATVPARRSWFVMLFLCAWLVGWVLGEVHAINEFVSPAENSSRAFLAVWLIGWTLGGGFAIATVLWQLSGKEILSITPTSLEHRIEVFGIGRTRQYRKSEIKNFRATEYASPPFTNQAAMFPPVTGAGIGPVAFDYGARTFRVAPALEEAEAKLLVERLVPHLPRTLQ